MAKTYTARAPELCAVRLDLRPEDRERLRVAAARAGLPMSEFARSHLLALLGRLEAREERRKNPRQGG